jgi:hypothetical protein
MLQGRALSSIRTELHDSIGQNRALFGTNRRTAGCEQRSEQADAQQGVQSDARLTGLLR